jgi:hypothetical protein
MDAYEHRRSIYGAFQTFLSDTPNLIPGYQELLIGHKYYGQTTSIPVINRATYSTSAARACTRKTAQNTSTFVDITFTTIETGFMMIPAEYEANYIKYQADFNRKMEDVQRTFLATLDTAAVTNLNTNKSAVNNADGNPYTVASNIMIVPNEDNDLFFNELGGIMLQNDFNGPFNVVGTPRVRSLVNELQAQGAGNSENRSFQFGELSLAYTRSITVPTGYRDVTYSMPVGSLGFLSWVDKDAQMNHKSGDGYEWYEQLLPLLGFNVGVLYSSTCADKAAAGSLTGLEATLQESWMFSFDYAFVNAYNSDASTYPGTIYRADFSKT